MSPASNTAFTHLEVHSHFTLLGGTAPVEALAARAAEAGMSHLALTDHQVLYGAIAFAQACRNHGIQPITGMTVDMGAPAETAGVGTQRGRLVLLAKNSEGYRNLCRISSWLQGDRARELRRQQGLPWEVLAEHSAGVLAIDGGRRGWLFNFLSAGRQPDASRYLSRLGGIFEENGWLGIELQRSVDSALAGAAIECGARFGLRPVALQPVYCLAREDRARLRLLAAIDANCTLETVPPAMLADGANPDIDVHWLSASEIAQRFSSFPQALQGIQEVVEQCGETLPDGEPIWPALKLPQQQTPAEALEEQAWAGLRDRYEHEPQPKVTQRLQEELVAINRHGFAPLFLVVADITRHARSEQIPVSTRGSVANSLVAYCLGITTVDPIGHNLLFARFLNPARKSPPDIDLDFCSRQRDRILAYVRQTYGEEHVALVSTMNTLRPRSALRETAKAFGYTEEELKRLSRRLPRGRWRQLQLEGEAVLGTLSDVRDRAVVQAALSIVGQPHHLSVHPGGVVITPGPLSDVVPLQWTPKGFVATQYAHEDVEAVGLPKLDLLGIRALTVLADAVSMVRRDANPDFKLERVDTEDVQTAACLARGETIGVFQCESEGAQRTLRQLQARTVGDLAVANAFFKPGPSTGGMAQAFIRRYRGEEPVSFLHPTLAELLGDTQGVLLFQEQVLRVARDIAGLSWAQADQLRRGMSKMHPRTMNALQEQFIAGCQRAAPEGAAFSAQQAQQLWEQVLAFSGYGFNRGHATAYADVSYRSAYLKTHFPAAFLCARLANGGGFYPQAVYIAEAQRLGIATHPPHVNHSESRFTLTYEQGEPVLWMGLKQVRSLRHSSVGEIVAGAPLDSLRDLLSRVSLQERELRNLIRCGALDGMAENRATLLAQAEALLRAGSPRQLSFDFAATSTVAAETAAERLKWEMRILGQPLSLHPVQLMESREELTPLSELSGMIGREVRIAAVRLPGRTGGRSILLGDGRGMIAARTPQGASSKAWEPLLLKGVWRRDEWGGGWFQVAEMKEVDTGG